MQTNAFPLQGLMPAHSPHLATTRPVCLPYGGPYGVGGSYAVGSGLTLDAGTAQSEVRTLTVGTSTGTLTHTFTADKPYVVTHAYNATTAAVQTAWEAVFGKGNVTVTGTAGTSYVLTFGSGLANKRIGGNLTISSNGNASWAQTTKGSAGAEQYDLFDNSTYTTIDALIENTATLNPQGGRATDVSSGTEQPYSPPAFVEGFFNYADIPNVVTGAVGNDKKLGWATGSASSTTGAVVRLSQKT